MKYWRRGSKINSDCRAADRGAMKQLEYQMIIVWSSEEGCYLVHLPDFPEQHYRTHGDSYAEAARNGQEVLALLLEEDGAPWCVSAQQFSRTLIRGFAQFIEVGDNCLDD